ncbi:riboflavin synthase subunit alpha [Lonepinella sp. MS14436]|uniref:riboflavin synthase subunit alpha n=1 Tax=Lonepinella sp. MS14436 TaxID=3003619 RepID=UPI0036D7D28D
MNTEQVTLQSEITTAKLMNNEIRTKLNKMRDKVADFHQARQQVKENITSVEQAIKFERKEKAMQKYVLPNKPPTDKDLENKIIQLAKTKYETWRDIETIAQELGVRAGVVYLTLKHHSFIRQTETSDYRVVDAYYRCNKNLGLIAEEVGFSVWVCAKILEKHSLSPNWQTYKNRANSLSVGDIGEELFRKLVPEAVDMNVFVGENNPRFDFIVNEKTIDVKTARKNREGTHKFRIRYQKGDEIPDYFCLFVASDEKEIKQNNYAILLIPKEAIPAEITTLPLPQKGSLKSKYAVYWDFEVPPDSVSSMLGII